MSGTNRSSSSSSFSLMSSWSALPMEPTASAMLIANLFTAGLTAPLTRSAGL